MHFAPTKQNKNILIEEGIFKKNIYVTGNPVIDTIKNSIKHINRKEIRKKKLIKKIIKELNFSLKNFVLVTIHRRE